MTLFSRSRVVVLLAGLIAASVVAPRARSADAVRSQQLVGVLRSSVEVAERARALQQLALVAAPDAIPAVAALLGDEKLGQYARDVLEQMPDAAAGEALRVALGTLRGSALIGVINSLGVRRDAAAVNALTRLANDSDVGPSKAALVALGRIGTADATRVIVSALARGSAEHRVAAAEACLLAAERAWKEGRPAAARTLYEGVRRADVPAPLRLSATRGILIGGSPEARALMGELLGGEDPAGRDLALRTVRELRDPELTPALVAQLDQLVPGLQPLVLEALVDRGGPGVVQVAETRAKHGKGEVQIAALRALGRIGRAESVGLLLDTVKGAAGAEAVEAALASLARIEVPNTTAQVLAVLPVVEPAVQVRLIAVLGERKSAAATPELLRIAAGPTGEPAKAALRALGLVAAPADLLELIALATAAGDEATRTLADRAIVTTAMKVLEPERRTEPVLRAFRDSNDPIAKAALLRPLGAIMRTMGGNHDVFFAVRAALKDPADVVRSAAVRCLADWPDAAPTTALLAFAAQPDASSAQREIAWRGAVRLATEVAAGRERSPLDVLAAFTTAQRLMRTPEEKMALVSGLGTLRRVEAVEMLRPYLDDPAVQAEAALALVQVASALPAASQIGGLKALLERIAATDKDEDVRRSAARLAKGGSVAAAKKKAGAAAGPGAAALSPGSLFNGQDLVGWDGDPGVWRVREGTIVGGSMLGNPRNEFLATRKRFKNFVLRLEYRIVGTEGFVNGGVQVRSVRIAQPPNEMSGYQADIGAGHSGCLYDESRRKKFLARATDEQINRLEKPGDWNRYEIRCDGPRVEISLNGEKTVSYTEDDPSVVPEGLIALQIHGNCKAEIAFRNLSIEERP